VRTLSVKTVAARMQIRVLRSILYTYISAIVSSIISGTKRTVQYKFTPSAVVTYIDLYSFILIVRRYSNKIAVLQSVRDRAL
jgi:hypothetical protein